jgi:DNA topoisomerase-1
MVALIKDRGYVRREKKVLLPTPLGLIVCDALVTAFPDLFDYGFTAKMEDQLDDIANGRAERLATLEQFWAGLSGAMERATEDMPTVRFEGQKPQPTGEKCPECGGQLVRRQGKHGAFVGCAAYPRCKYVQRRKPKTTGGKCPLCGGDLVARQSKYGPFLGCANYPACKYIDKETSKKR